jgi:hypothetical protein
MRFATTPLGTCDYHPSRNPLSRARCSRRQPQHPDLTLASPESGEPFAADIIPQRFRFQNLYVLAVAQDPPPEFRAQRDPKSQLQLAGQKEAYDLAGVPLPLGDIAGDLPGESEPNLNWVAPEDPEASFQIAIQVEFTRRLE